MQLWLVAAFASALFAGIVSILAKCGIKTIDSDVATALRTCVVAVFTWVMVAIAGSAGTIGGIRRSRGCSLRYPAWRPAARGSATSRRFQSAMSIKSCPSISQARLWPSFFPSCFSTKPAIWAFALRAPRLLRRAGETSMRLLGGFAGGIDPKGRRPPAFSQVGNADIEQRPRKTAQNPGDHVKIGGCLLRNRTEVAIRRRDRGRSAGRHRPDVHRDGYRIC